MAVLAVELGIPVAHQKPTELSAHMSCLIRTEELRAPDVSLF